MEVNHYVIMDKFPSNELIAGIHMTGNRIFPLTLKLTKKKNTTLVVGKGKTVQLDTAFTTKSECSSDEENSARGTKKGEIDTKIHFSLNYMIIFGHGISDLDI